MYCGKNHLEITCKDLFLIKVNSTFSPQELKVIWMLPMSSYNLFKAELQAGIKTPINTVIYKLKNH